MITPMKVTFPFWWLTLCNIKAYQKEVLQYQIYGKIPIHIFQLEWKVPNHAGFFYDLCINITPYVYIIKAF